MNAFASLFATTAGRILAALILASAGAIQAQESSPASPAETPGKPAKSPEQSSPAITGVWRNKEAGGGKTAWKFVQDGHWSMTEQSADGTVSVHHGGSFTLEGDVYAEKVLWAGSATRSLIGKTFSYRAAIEGNTCTLQGLDNSWGGKWTRVLPGEKAAEAAAVPPPPDPAALRKADLELLLTEFKKQAGTLLERKKVNWDAVTAWCLAEAEKVKTNEDHLRLCQRLLARLCDGHARLEGARISFPDDSEGRPWVNPPVHLILTKDGVAVMGSSEDVAAAGVLPGMLVTQIDGRPAREWLEAKVDEWLDRTCYSTRHHALYTAARWGLGGWAGTKVTLTLKSGDGEKPVELTRARTNAAVAFKPEKQLPGLDSLGRHTWGKTAGGFGYIHLGNTPGDLPQQLDTMLEGIGDVPGMILDMRGNSGGGCDHAAVFGRFLEKEALWGSYEGQGARPYAGPMVVILDAGCASAGETVGGQFGEDQRAFMIGDTPTAGMSSQKTRVRVPSGMFTAYFSVASNKGRFNLGRGIEGIGVQPVETVPWEAADLAAGIDTEIRRAEEILKTGIPEGAIDYVPPVPAKTEEPAGTEEKQAQ